MANAKMDQLIVKFSLSGLLILMESSLLKHGAILKDLKFHGGLMEKSMVMVAT